MLHGRQHWSTSKSRWILQPQEGGAVLQAQRVLKRPGPSGQEHQLACLPDKCSSSCCMPRAVLCETYTEAVEPATHTYPAPVVASASAQLQLPEQTPKAFLAQPTFAGPSAATAEGLSGHSAEMTRCQLLHIRKTRHCLA